MEIVNTNAGITSSDVFVEEDMIKLKHWKAQVEADIASLERRIPLKKSRGEDPTVLQMVLELQNILRGQICSRMNEVSLGECPDLYAFKRAAMEVITPGTLSEIEERAKGYMYA